MILLRHSLLAMLLLVLLIPAYPALTVQQEADGLDTEEVTSKEKKSDKKKKKDVIEIDEEFFISLGINLVTVLLIISLIYYPNYKRMDNVFTYIAFNIIIFLLTFVLNKVKISMGAAFGLFAVFSMLRYRTEGISMTDMTYLFSFIALGLISAIHLEYYELLIISAIVFATIFVLEGNFLLKRELSKRILYENIDYIRPEHREDLIRDLRERTGLNVHRYHITKIDFLKDMATIIVYYFAGKDKK